jgi:hypothetical protein
MIVISTTLCSHVAAILNSFLVKPAGHNDKLCSALFSESFRASPGCLGHIILYPLRWLRSPLQPWFVKHVPAPEKTNPGAVISLIRWRPGPDFCGSPAFWEMSDLVLAVCRISGALTAAIRQALLSVGLEIAKNAGGSLIVVEKFTLSGAVTELWRVFWRAQQNACGLFVFCFHPTEVDEWNINHFN